jgi:hypothetical protein
MFVVFCLDFGPFFSSSFVSLLGVINLFIWTSKLQASHLWLGGEL